MSKQAYRESKKARNILKSEEKYRIILEINNSIISTLRLNELFLAIASVIDGKLPFDASALALYKSEKDVFEIYPFGELLGSKKLAPGAEIPRVGSHVGWVFDNRKSLIADDLSLEQGLPFDKILFEEGIRSYVVTPLITGERIIGTLNLGGKTPNKFEGVETEFLSLIGKQIALAIDNARSHEEIEKLKNQLEMENVSLQEEIKTAYNFEEIVGESKALKNVFRQVEMVAKTDSTVLIRGETGTGKELIARAIHDLSTRRDRPLIKVNCPGIPPGLIESELFGHEKGAFTTALSRKIGKFELADGGTIFLDELGDLPFEAQAKLLRVLQEREFERVGGTETHKVDVRVITATNRDLEKALKEGKFRADLFYRLNVFPLVLPPLRKRKEDIPLLATYFAQKYMSKLGKKIKSVKEETIDRLKGYYWPGNIRELENIVERAVILSNGETLHIDEPPFGSLPEASYGEDKIVSLEDNEREYIIKVLNQTNWRINGDKGAAKLLGINPNTLRSRMEKLGIKNKDKFKHK